MERPGRGYAFSSNNIIVTATHWTALVDRNAYPVRLSKAPEKRGLAAKLGGRGKTQ